MIAVDNGSPNISQAKAMFQSSAAGDALAEFREAALTNRLEQLMLAAAMLGCSELYPEAINMFRALPMLAPVPFGHPEQLVACGVWAAGPSNWDSMSISPRYFPGRQVLLLRRELR